MTPLAKFTLVRKKSFRSLTFWVVLWNWNFFEYWKHDAFDNLFACLSRAITKWEFGHARPIKTAGLAYASANSHGSFLFLTSRCLVQTVNAIVCAGWSENLLTRFLITRHNWLLSLSMRIINMAWTESYDYLVSYNPNLTTKML